jgi:hypothetical protein
MTKQEAKKLKDHDYVTDGNRFYHLQIHHSNKYDLWFWHCRKGTKKKLLRSGGKVTRVYLGSRNLPPSNLAFLAKLQAE